MRDYPSMPQSRKVLAAYQFLTTELRQVSGRIVDRIRRLHARYPSPETADAIRFLEDAPPANRGQRD